MSPSNEAATELTWRARRVVYVLRHMIGRKPLDEQLALRRARALVLQPLMGISTEEARAALLEAVNSDVELATWQDDPRFEILVDENDFREHLAQVVHNLDAMRPWPVPLFRALSPDNWSSYRTSRTIGAIHLPVPTIEDRVHTHLLVTEREEVDGNLRVAIFELRSGHEIALVGRWWPDAPDVVAVLTRDPEASAQDLMAELTSGDHFEPGEYEVLG